MIDENNRGKVWRSHFFVVSLRHYNAGGMTTKECIDILNACRFTLQDKYGILSLRLFGSTARNEQNSDSDVDVFVETKTPNPFLLMEARDYLEESTGRSVDIVRNHRNLNPRLRKRIEKDGITVF